MYDLQFNDFQKNDLVLLLVIVYTVFILPKNYLLTLGTSCKYNHIVFSYSSTY